MHRVTIEGHVMAAVAYQLLIYRSGWPELQLVMQCLYVCMITKGKGSLDDLRKLTKLSYVCFSFSESLEVRKKLAFFSISCTVMCFGMLFFCNFIEKWKILKTCDPAG